MRSRGARHVLSCVFVSILAAAAAPAEEAVLPPDTDTRETRGTREEEEPPPPASDATIAARIESLEKKLDRIDELLRLLFASRLRRVELLARNEGLGLAIRAVDERYSVPHIAEALTEDDIEKLARLRKTLARAAATAGVREFAADPDVVTVLAAMAGRPDFLTRHGRTFLAALLGRDAEALGELVLAMLERDSPGAKEAALWAAPRAEGALLPARLSSFARELDEGMSRAAGLSDARPADGNGSADVPDAHFDIGGAGRVAEPIMTARLYALAQAAAASHGDHDAAGRLTRAAREGRLAGVFAHGLAGELASAGSKAAFRVYLELLRDERYAFAASQAFNRIQGFDRHVAWREVRENRMGLYEEFRAWLERNYEKLRYEPRVRRFTVE